MDETFAPGLLRVRGGKEGWDIATKVRKYPSMRAQSLMDGTPTRALSEVQHEQVLQPFRTLVSE